MKAPLLFAIFAGLILFIGSNQIAYGHILVQSDSRDSSMIVHVIPDDDPIAGEKSSIFFDIKSNKISNSISDYSLTISSDRMEPQLVEVQEVGDYGVKVDYTFPYQGVYQIELLSVSSPEERFIFSQRVSRGVTDTNSIESINNEWAEAGLIVGISMIVVILILIINRRREILNFSSAKNGGKK